MVVIFALLPALCKLHNGTVATSSSPSQHVFAVRRTTVPACSRHRQLGSVRGPYTPKAVAVLQQHRVCAEPTVLRPGAAVHAESLGLRLKIRCALFSPRLCSTTTDARLSKMTTGYSLHARVTHIAASYERSGTSSGKKEKGS
eukprot:IDg20173t1